MPIIHHDATLVPTKLEVVSSWIGQQRWYAAKGATPRLRRVGGFRFDDHEGKVGTETLVVADDSAETPVVYQVPLTYRDAPLEGGEDGFITTMEHSVLGTRYVYDAVHDPVYVGRLVETVTSSGVSEGTQAAEGANEPAAGESRTRPLRVVSSKVLSGEQSNTSVICEVVDAETGEPVEPVIIKVFRMLQDGANPDVVVQSALRDAGCERVPESLGSLSGVWDSPTSGRPQRGHLAFAQRFMAGVEDAWRVALRAATDGSDFTVPAAELGVVTAEIHEALRSAMPTHHATESDRDALRRSMLSRLDAAIAVQPSLESKREQVTAVIEEAHANDWPEMQRVHGDYHLGQVLHSPDAGWLALDFEGEPLRPIEERTAPDLAVRDVAGMLRSFDYAAGSVEMSDNGADPRAWAADCRAAFLHGYASVAGEFTESERRLERALELDKALYEVVYEARNRPDWLSIPLHAVERLVSDQRSTTKESHVSNLHDLPVLDPGAVEAFLDGRNGMPHDLLGQHLGPGGLTITAYKPLARSVRAKLDTGEVLDLAHVRDGFWSVTSAEVTATHDYRLLCTWDDGVEHTQDDPYRFTPTIGEIDLHLIGEGRHEQLWTVLGAHIRTYRGPLGDTQGASFAVWAPNAKAVHVIGDFNGWDRRSHPMRMLGSSGVWELFVPNVGEGQNYQYAIRGADDIVRTKSDPMAQRTECPPKVASVVTRSTYEWNDADWMEKRPKRQWHAEPMSIYECHIGSWRQGLSYTDLAEHLVNYVKDLGYTHVEFLPVAEHPFGPSWGYQVTGYYAPTARFGTPDEFRLLVDRLHQEGIGVIVDWVPGHFPKDEFALGRFDGTALYEHADPRKGEQPDWGTYIFNFGRNEVRNFLVANAIYWLEEFHVDGLRVDAVASMLYLDYSREGDNWVPNMFGGRENLEAISLLQETNATVYKRVGGIITAAEESTSWPGVTRATEHDGLGFGFKWNMGWMNDTLRYLNEDPVNRSWHHNNLTFAMVYAWSENFILPISHDEVVHGKGSLLRKAPGSRDQQLANLRAYLAFMWGHPGKQLLFMGCEFGQESEWADGRSLDWWLLDQPMHYRVHAQVKDMNAIYKAHPAMWQLDTEPAGFDWLNADDHSGNTISWLRWGEGDRLTAPVMLCATNFSGMTHERYRLGVPRGGKWKVIMDTAGYHPDAPSSAGIEVEASSDGWNGQSHSVELTLAALSTVWVVPVEETGQVQALAPAVEESQVDLTVDAS